MNFLEERIVKDGVVKPGNVLKVDSFLNHQMDITLMEEIGREFKRRFGHKTITKVMTIESSGIAIAAAVGMAMKVPMVFAKKHKTSNVDGYVYSTVVHSFTHGTDYNVVVSCDYLREGERVLLVDDFLANGNALNGLIDLVEQAGATVVGAACAIEKGFQNGGDQLRAKGYKVESLAIIDSMDGGKIRFRK